MLCNKTSQKSAEKEFEIQNVDKIKRAREINKACVT